MKHTYKMPEGKTFNLPDEVFEEALKNNIPDILKEMQNEILIKRRKLELKNIDNDLNRKYFDWVELIGAIINPKMTQTELFLNIPNSLILNFDRL